MEPILSAEQAAWMQAGLTSVVVASRNTTNHPSLGWGLGCRVSPDLRRIVVFLLESQSYDTLSDLRAGRPVSVLFTQAATTRALQLKASRAREVPLLPSDPALLDAYAKALGESWSGVIEQPHFASALMSRESDQLVAFELTPEAAFDQTPGPRAGAALHGGA